MVDRVAGLVVALLAGPYRHPSHPAVYARAAAFLADGILTPELEPVPPVEAMRLAVAAARALLEMIAREDTRVPDHLAELDAIERELGASIPGAESS